MESLYRPQPLNKFHSYLFDNKLFICSLRVNPNIIIKKQVYFLDFALIGFQAAAQTDPREAEIRRLENIERVATMQGDSAVLFGKIWSNEIVGNTLLIEYK